MCIWSLISLEALVFEKRIKMHRLNIVDAENKDANTAARKRSLCRSCLLKQSWQKQGSSPTLVLLLTFSKAVFLLQFYFIAYVLWLLELYFDVASNHFNL